MNSDSTVLSGDAIRAVADLAQTQQLKVGDRDFTTRPIHRVDLDPELPRALDFATLDGLAGYLAIEPEAKDAIVHVASPVSVRVVSALFGQDKSKRREIASGTWKNDGGMQGFQFDRYESMENLAIALQTCFQPAKGDVDELRSFCAGVKSTSEAGTADDGVSQTVTAKAGISIVSTVKVRNPWMLAPWRTFPELDQPLSPFVLRFNRGEAPTGGLFRTGNATWYNEAVRAVAGYLTAKVTQKVVG